MNGESHVLQGPASLHVNHGTSEGKILCHLICGRTDAFMYTVVMHLFHYGERLVNFGNQQNGSKGGIPFV
jgi:hypothetical protein